MITDDPKEMKRRLTEYVNDASEALETLEAIDPDFDTTKRIEPGSDHERYVQALNKLNTARVWLGMAAEQLHDLLNDYHERMIDASQEKRERDATPAKEPYGQEYQQEENHDQEEDSAAGPHKER
jgi:hypothetical protein